MSNHKSLPAPTADLEQAERYIREHGLAIVEGVLPDQDRKRYADELLHVAEVERRAHRPGTVNAADQGTQRVWNLPSRSPLFCELIEHPTALRLVEATIGWPGQNQAGPKSKSLLWPSEDVTFLV